jgi:hypothetical protein
MPETANYGFEYETPSSKPGITLTGDIDGSAPILAEQVDSVLVGIDTRLTAAEGSISILEAAAAHDTGWIDLSVTAATGFSLVYAVYRLWGPMVSIDMQYIRTGADIVANASGNVVGDPLVCTINTVPARPSRTTPVIGRASVTSATVDMITNGEMNISDMRTNSTLATDNTLRFSVTYFGTTFN